MDTEWYAREMLFYKVFTIKEDYNKYALFRQHKKVNRGND